MKKIIIALVAIALLCSCASISPEEKYQGTFKGNHKRAYFNEPDHYTYIVKGATLTVRSDNLKWSGVYSYDKDADSIYLDTKDKFGIDWHFELTYDGSNYYATFETRTFKVKKIK